MDQVCLLTLNKKQRSFLRSLTYFLSGDTICFSDETKCNINESKYDYYA